jgi:DNA adenine methylase
VTAIKPPVPYYGGKITLAPQIVDLFPAHQHYVEPYCGSLAVLLAKPRSVMETVNDLDGDLVTFWRVLRDHPAEMVRVCALTPHSRAEHQAAYGRDDVDDLETARRVWVQLTQGRAGLRKRTGWRHHVDPVGSSAGMPDYLDGYVRRMLPAAERLAGVSLESKPALDLIAKYGVNDQVLLYVDPPYLGSTRSGSSWNGYQVEMRGDDEHRKLADALQACAASVVLSGYPSALYDELYAGWWRTEMAASTGQGGTWENRTEVLWSNRPLGEPTLFDLNGGAA